MNNRAQTTMETVMLLMIVVAAFLAMFPYFKGALQGNYKTNTDAFSPKQYGGGAHDSDSGSISYTNTVLGVSLNGDKTPEVSYNNLHSFPNDDGRKAIKKVNGWGTYSR